MIHKHQEIQHINEDLYLINHTAISFADNGLDLTSNELKFGNPRYYFQNDGKIIAKGLLNDPAIDVLRETIKTQGLKNPPQLRIIKQNGETKFEIVEGERRIRSILKLISDEEQVFDPVTKSYIPAAVKYEKIQVRIEEMDEKTAISRAFCANDRAVGIGEAATVVLVKKLRNCKLSDEEICNITGLGISWLKETDKIINLDNTTFQALATEKINRTLALKLADLGDEERLEKLNALLDAAQLRLEKIQKQLEQQKEKVEERLDIAEAEIIEAEYKEQDKEKPKAKKAKAEKKLKEIEQKEKELKDDGIKANIKDWDNPKPLTTVKIKKYWLEPINNLIQENSDCEGTIDVEDIHLIQTICEKIEIGDQNIIEILQNHKNWKSEEFDKVN